MSIEIRTAGLDDFLDSKQGLKILLLGAPSAGKTPWAAQAPKPLFLAVDDSTMASLAITNTPYIRTPELADVTRALDWVIEEHTRPSFEYETIVLDTISVLMKRHEARLLSRQPQARSLGDIEGGWDRLKAGTQEVLTRLAKLQRLNVIVNVHQKGKFESTEYEPDLVGSAKGDVPKDFPFIGHIRLTWSEVARDAKGDPVDPKAERTAQRNISWQATPTFPILRSPGGALDTTPLTFSPADWQAVVDGVSAKLKSAAIPDAAVVATVETSEPEPEGPAPAPADVEGGPLEPKPLPKVTARTRKAEPTHEEAVKEVEEGLGGQVQPDPIAEAIAKANSNEELRQVWAANTANWTPEHTDLASARKKELPPEEES